MKIIRPIKLQDTHNFVNLAFTAHAGVTSLPKNRVTLEKKVSTSIDSFNKTISDPDKELYLFILEDTETNMMIGTSGIWARTGFNQGSYFYRIETFFHDNHTLPLPLETIVLHPACYTNGPAEIGSLFLHNEYRKGGFGKLLSLSRFLFVATFPERFDRIILSNMRGTISPEGNSPFWDGFGRHFLNMSFLEVMDLLDRGDKTFILSFIPKYPVYALLLSKEAQEAIGKVHPNTMPALNMLTIEGFRDAGQVDIFDGGPILTAQTENIRTVKESRVALIRQIEPLLSSNEEFIICNQKIDFRACFGDITLDDNGNATLDPETAKALQVEIGEQVRFVMK